MVKLDVNCSNIHKETKAVFLKHGTGLPAEASPNPFKGDSQNPRGKKKKGIFFFSFCWVLPKTRTRIEYSLLYSTCWIDSLVCVDQSENYPATKNNELTTLAGCVRHNEFSNICLQLVGRVDFPVWYLAYWLPERHNWSPSCYTV